MGTDQRIPGGYILHPRMLTRRVMDGPPLHTKVWDLLLLEARYKDQGKLKRGQLFTTIEMMREAMSYRIGFRKILPSRKEIRGAYEALMKGTMIGITKVTGGMIVTILNYAHYQDPKNYEGHNEGHDEKSPKGTSSISNKERVKKETPPSVISAEISSLSGIYSPELLERIFSAISSTRKTNRITESVKLRFLQDCGKYPVRQVEAGLRVYLEKDYASLGKGEKYLLGIIRNQNGQTVEAPDPMTRKSSGSTALDDYYRSQGYRITA